MSMADRNSKKKYPWTAKRAAAWIGIALLAALYALTLIFAVFDFKGADRLFRISLGFTIAVPLMLWLILWMIGYLKHRSTDDTNENR